MTVSVLIAFDVFIPAIYYRNMSQKKIALVADWITHWGGAERIFVKLMDMYPEAEIYSSVFFPDRPEYFK